MDHRTSQSASTVIGHQKAETASPSAITLAGLDNFKKPRQDFANKIAALDDPAFTKETEHRIWLSGYANNNPRSDYHWQADACYDEAQRRGKPDLYTVAYARVIRGVS